MRAYKKRWLLMIGLMVATSIPASRLLQSSSSTTANNAPDKKIAFNATNPKDELASAIEAARYTRMEFFGSSALVPYPTEEARTRLVAVAQRYPKSEEAVRQLAEVETELGHPEAAEKAWQRYAELTPNPPAGLRQLATFYERQAQPERQIETLIKLMAIVPDTERSELLSEIINLAEHYNLAKYREGSFYQEMIERYPKDLKILTNYINKLINEKEYASALNLVVGYRQDGQDDNYFFLRKHSQILVLMDRIPEAEKVYTDTFDPFWPESVSSAFYYNLLSANDRLREYGRELRAACQKDPSNFNLAVRLIDYYSHNNDSEYIKPLYYQLEEARTRQHQSWQPTELLTLARISLKQGDAERASRYVYTLYQQEHLKPGSEMRGVLLYQLFELLADAGNSRLPLTRGNLQFYQDIAQADPHPGAIGGLLSLVLADSHPQREFKNEQEQAIEHFNQAAAYRIFTAYKKEYPTSPQLAQMYLDLIQLYTKTGDTKLAEQLLTEFAERYQHAEKFAEVAMKLADAYITTEQPEKELVVYQQILDYLGKQSKPGRSLMATNNVVQPEEDDDDDETRQRKAITPPELEEPTNSKPTPEKYASINQGIKLAQGESNNSYYRYGEASFNDYLDESVEITYPIVLSRYIATLDQAHKVDKIIALYSNEIKKYPNEPALYEQLLQWLGQTNLTDQQLAVYQQALKQFPTTLWYDRMARWFIKQRRQEDFAQFSTDILQKFDDQQIQDYFGKFINSRINASQFDDRLYLALYSYAHNRFPENLTFVHGLLNYYSSHKQWDEWRELLAAYYFIAPDVRQQYLTHLASKQQLRDHLAEARNKLAQSVNNFELLPYKMFRADAAIWLSNYEEGIDAYRELVKLYPGNTEFSSQLVGLTRSFGQQNIKFLVEAAATQKQIADLYPGDAEARTTTGELYAEMSEYQSAKAQWQRLLTVVKDRQSYLDTATVFWDYFQYDDARKTIAQFREQQQDDTLLAFEMGAILEAQHQTKAAIAEYIKGMDKENEQYYHIQQRLALLYDQDLAPEIQQAFEQKWQKTEEPEALILAYVEMLKKVAYSEQETLIQKILMKAAARSKDTDFLQQALSHFRSEGTQAQQKAILARLIEQSKNFRDDIDYRLQMIGLSKSNGARAQAAQQIAALVNKYPVNYGVINEAVQSYWQIGYTNQAVSLLRKAQQQSQGKFHYEFSRRLASRELALNHPLVAQKLLEKLFSEDQLNREVLDDLIKVYLRTKNSKALEETLNTGLIAVKAQDKEPTDLRLEVASFREYMIQSFTQMRDYPAAIDQHIEIINGNPLDEEKLTAAIEYTERYGGGARLAGYYQEVFRQAYKNYRWGVVLARIYAAQQDFPNAVRYYQTAIDNQPEMAELYAALADIYGKQEQYPAALKAIQQAIKLSDGSVEYIRTNVTLLEKAGRKGEADQLRAKLPKEQQPTAVTPANTPGDSNLTQLANQNAAAEAEKNLAQIIAHPYDQPVESYKLNGYINSLHYQSSFTQLLGRLWQWRNQISSEVANPKSTLVGKATPLLDTINEVLKTLGEKAQSNATSEELAEFHQDLATRIEQAINSSDSSSLATLQNIAQAANFSDLREQIVLHNLETQYKQRNFTNYHTQLHQMLDFYAEQGQFVKALALLEQQQAKDEAAPSFNYLEQIVEFSQLAGDREKELSTLRKYFAKTQNLTPVNQDPLIARYFNLLYHGNATERQEFDQLINKYSRYQTQLINFLIAQQQWLKVHQAIGQIPQDPLKRNLQQALLSFKAGDYQNGDYFQPILQLGNIGEMAKTKPNPQVQLTGIQWFEQAYNYGQWLYNAPEAQRKTIPAALLPAMLEARPQDREMSYNLGHWYLGQGDKVQALKYLGQTYQMGNTGQAVLVDLGNAYFLNGDQKQANEYWAKIISDPSTSNYQVWLETLKEHGLAESARAQIWEYLRTNLSPNKELTGDEQTTLKAFVQMLAQSFRDKGKTELTPAQAAQQAQFFSQICQQWSKDTRVAEQLINSNLLDKAHLASFYQLLIQRSAGIPTYQTDPEYKNRLQGNSDRYLLEETLDHSKDFKGQEPGSLKIKYQKDYLQLLLANKQYKEAEQLGKEIEQALVGRYVRPQWLRLAQIEAQLHTGQQAVGLKDLYHYAMIEASPKLANIKLPDLQRVNEGVQLLQKQGLGAEAIKLRQAYYERSLALEQYETPNLVGLISSYYQQGEKESAEKWLELMLKLANRDNAPTTEAAIAAFPNIKAWVAPDKFTTAPEMTYNVTLGEALTAAAELTTANGNYNLAIQYRKQLWEGDVTNRLELARLMVANNQSALAIDVLLQLVENKDVSRQGHWQALYLLIEVAGTNTELWAKTEKVTDKELKAALQASRLVGQGQVAAARNILKSNYVSAEMKFFQARLERDQQQPQLALQLFAEVAGQQENRLNLLEPSALRQMIYLASVTNSPQAVLRLANKDSRVQQALYSYQNNNDEIETAVTTANTPKLKLLKVIEAEKEQQATREILALTAQAAEAVGNFELAIKYQQTLKIVSPGKEAKAKIQTHIDQLTAQFQAINSQWTLEMAQQPQR